MAIARRFWLATILALSIGATAIAEPLFTLTDDAFLYRSRPGESPSTVATMFGIGPDALPAFLKANGISDATRVPAGHVYRIPSPFAARAQSAEASAQALQRELAATRTRSDALERELASARETANEAAARAERLARYESSWWIAVGLGTLLTLLLVGAVIVAARALRQAERAGQYAHALADELEEKRKRHLTERQDAARRILDLEAEVQQLKARREFVMPAAGRRAPGGR